MFADRTAAGQQLARALARRGIHAPLVLGLPRGGVVVAAEVARALAGELNLMLVKKLRAPGSPELAIGAVSEEGRVFLNPEVVRLSGAGANYIEAERSARLDEMSAQQALYRRIKPPPSINGRSVILVDDGLATGATMIAAARAVAQEQPRELFLAVPVSPPDAFDALCKLPWVAEVICLIVATDFQGVGQFYQDFKQVTDAEVLALLQHGVHK